jgi:argininosuccinate lyase
MRKALFGGMLTATELADYLVRKGTPLRTAHEQVGAAVRAAEEHGCELHELPPTVLGECCPGVETDVARVLDPEHTAGAHDSPGGPAPVRVREQLARARRMLEAGREWLVSNEPPPIYLAHQDGTLDREDLL